MGLPGDRDPRLIISRNANILEAYNVSRRKVRGGGHRSLQEEHDYTQAIMDKIKEVPNDVMPLPEIRSPWHILLMLRHWEANAKEALWC